MSDLPAAVELDPAVGTAIRAHAREAFPREACGLLGCPPGDRVRLVRYLRVPNAAAATNRFEMDPIAVVRAERTLRAEGLVLGGTFHSHPSASATPSVADHSEAWSGLVHVILSVDQGVPSGEPTAWIRRGDRLWPLSFVGGRCPA